MELCESCIKVNLKIVLLRVMEFQFFLFPTFRAEHVKIGLVLPTTLVAMHWVVKRATMNFNTPCLG